MKIIVHIFFLISICFCAHAQRIIGDCTIRYDVSIHDEANDMTTKATKMLYLRGNQVRTDFEDNDYTQTLIVDGGKGVATLLKTVGKNKLASILDSVQWREYNMPYWNVQYNVEKSGKIILGYHCHKASATAQDGSTITLYFTSDIYPTYPENAYQFKDIPGLILQYESVSKDKTVFTSYAATSVNLMPVLYSYFAPSLKGFRIVNDMDE